MTPKYLSVYLLYSQLLCMRCNNCLTTAVEDVAALRRLRAVSNHIGKSTEENIHSMLRHRGSPQIQRRRTTNLFLDGKSLQDTSERGKQKSILKRKKNKSSKSNKGSRSKASKPKKPKPPRPSKSSKSSKSTSSDDGPRGNCRSKRQCCR